MAPTPRTPQRGDVVLAVVVTALAIALLALLPALSELEPGGDTSASGPGHWAWWAALVATLAQGARLAWISSAPRHVLAAMAAIALLAAPLPIDGGAGVHLLPVIAAAYIATRQREPQDSWIPWVVTVLLTAAAGAIANIRLDGGLLVPVAAATAQALVVIGIPTAAAAVAGARAQMRSSREREAVARAGELEARMEASLADERTAIARELHDIAAHHLSGIALMSSAISQQIDTDPDAAKAGLADVRAQTRTLLDELRALVALLRQDDGASVEVESLAGLEDLIPTAQARGLEVELSVGGGASIRELSRGIGPLGQFAAYRTVQESLANAARHAPGARCAVEVTDAGGSLEILVTNGPGSSPATADARATAVSASTGGFGLRGMEERAALTRSTLSYGPTDDGGWHVRLRMPREPGHPDSRPDTPSHSPTEAQS